MPEGSGTIGKYLIAIGLLIVFVGVLVVIAGRFPGLAHSAAAVGPDARLYVVESREAGAVDVPLAVDGLSLQPSKVE